MKCPVCHTDTLAPMEFEGVELDFCHGCKGIWFDQGEAAFYLETTRDMPALKSVLDGATDTDKACPRCDVPMVEIDYVPDADLRLDVCVGCRGIFVDGGEMPKLERLAAALQPEGKVQRTMKALERAGYVILGAEARK